MPRKPDKREQKRIDKRNLEEESRRAKVILLIEKGASLRDAGRAVGRCHMYAGYWRDIAMTFGYRGIRGIRRKVWVRKSGWKALTKIKRPGPSKGIHPKRDAHREKAIELKREYPRIGCAKLAVMGGLGISGPTLCEILKSERLIEPVKAVKRKGKRFRAKNPNDMWQIDYVDVGHDCHLLSVMDDCSGKILAREIRRTMTTDDVLEIMDKCFSEYGIPKLILSDHGTQWYTVRGGDNRFDRMCLRRDIEHIMGRINHPQTQGKVERWHRTLKFESDIKDADTLEKKMKVLDGYVDFYNAVRPHWGIDLKTPDSVYFATVPV